MRFDNFPYMQCVHEGHWVENASLYVARVLVLQRYIEIDGKESPDPMELCIAAYRGALRHLRKHRRAIRSSTNDSASLERKPGRFAPCAWMEIIWALRLCRHKVRTPL